MAPTAGTGSGYYGRPGRIRRFATTAVELAGGYRMQPGEGFHPGRGGEGSPTEARATEDVVAKAPTEGMVVKSGTEAKAHKVDVVAKGSTERAALAGLAQWEAGGTHRRWRLLAALTEPEVWGLSWRRWRRSPAESLSRRK